ncbi:macrophage mannose receptor 1-like [Anthonomus grandis grandis]|uniref:macrophage mannose receptor 1-like n=1 Tax=Anthonomus grandis grandis TaxID=2921223 RepID=UPI0021663895|nr:macrophage mannose receptor 1-like [Anthonomus grandis grandis]
MFLHNTLRVWVLLSFVNMALFESPNLDRKKLCLNKSKEEKAYAIVPFEVNWYQAFVFCRNKKMDLVIITSKEEEFKLNEEIKAYAPSNLTAFWLSAVKFGVSGFFPFIWFSDASPVIYNNWGTTNVGILQPDNYGGNENCVVTNRITSAEVSTKRWGTFKTTTEDPLSLKMYWSDEKCENKFAFVCQVKC